MSLTRRMFLRGGIAAAMLAATSACRTFHAGAPAGFAGEWSCEDFASDGSTDTSFYELLINEDGQFSLYDAAAGNPGISGQMGNDSGTAVECRFDTDDFDAPFCWTLSASGDSLDYELEGDTLRLGHGGVWLTFHPLVDAGVPVPLPEPLDHLVSYDLPPEFSLDLEMGFGYDDTNPVVERCYTSEQSGYFAARILSYQGRDCQGDVRQTIDFESYVNDLARAEQIPVDGEQGYLGTRESDDMPGMVAVAYVRHGDYAFEFRLTNYDEQVTDEQLQLFKQIVGSVTFTY